MKNKISSIITAVSFLAVIVFFAVFGIVSPDKEISYSERRKLAALPEFSAEKLFGETGKEKYFDELEKYLLDQFPGRDAFGEVMCGNIVRHVDSDKAQYVEDKKQHSSVIAFYCGFQIHFYLHSNVYFRNEKY